MSNFILSAFADEIDSSLVTQMDVLDKYNIKYIEMRGVNGRNISEYSLDEAAEIKLQLDKRNFKVSAIGSPIGKVMITDDFTAHFKLFQHVLDIAKILETKYIRIFSFYLPEGCSPEIYRCETVSRLKEMVREAEAKGITLLHENEKGIYGDIPERCLDIIESVNSKYLRATFDPANFIQCDINPYPAAYNLLKEHIEYIHIKDALSSNHNVVPSGDGDGKIEELLTDLKKANYQGFLSLEPHLTAFFGFHQLEQNDNTVQESCSEGEQKFDIAFRALNKILSSIG